MTQTSTEAGASPRATVRLDKWLWAARFYKTRSQATEAIHAGHVKAGGDRLKAGHAVGVGQRVEVVKAGIDWEIDVIAVSDHRGSGADAAKLYVETEEGKKRRLAQIELSRSTAHLPPPAKGRPTKQNRRLMARFRSGL